MKKNKVLRVFILVMTTLALLTSPLSADTTSQDSASVSINTYVGETAENTGIRITEDVTPLQTMEEFNLAFFNTGNEVSVSNTITDNSVLDVEGKFSVLVRRQAGSSLTVSIKTNPIRNVSQPTRFLDYNLISETKDLVGGDATNNVIFRHGSLHGIDPAEYIADGSIPNNSILMDQAIFTYIIPANLNALAGQYTGIIEFTLIAP